MQRRLSHRSNAYLNTRAAAKSRRPLQVSPITARSTDHRHRGCRAILQAVQHELDTGGDAEFVEDAEEVIADDLLLAEGWTARRVAVSGYLVSGLLGLLGWFAVQGGMRRSVILGAAVLGALLVAALCLRAVRTSAMRNSPFRVQL